MFEQLVSVAKDIRGEMLDLYWLLLLPVVLLLIVLEFCKAQKDSLDVAMKGRAFLPTLTNQKFLVELFIKSSWGCRGQSP